MLKFGEVLTAMVTPFDRSGNIDWSGVDRLVDHLLQNGTDTLVVAGSTGEAATMSVNEKVMLFERVAKRAAGLAKVIAGTGSNNTQGSIELTRQAEQVGVDGVMLVAPYYNKPPQDALYAHFTAVAQATNLPVLVYNVPGRTSCNILPATVARLAQVENIFGVKEASGNLDQVSEIVRITPPGFVVYSGDDSLTLPILAVGGHGVVSVAAHLVGREIKQMIAAYRQGRVDDASTIHQSILPICKAMFITTNPMPLKAALNMIGVAVGGLRLPLIECNSEEKEALRKALKDYALL